jgi:hypothetical protein
LLTQLVAATTGSCAITFNLDQYQYSKQLWPNVTGNIGTTLFPGSALVLNRASNTLEPCTKQLCPTSTFSNRTQQFVNYAPMYCVFRSRFFPDPTATPEALAGTRSFYQFISTMSLKSYVSPLLASLKPVVANASATNGTNATTPTPNYGFNPKPLLDYGYNLNDSISFVPAFLAGYTHKNQLQDITLPGASYFRWVLHPHTSTYGSDFHRQCVSRMRQSAAQPGWTLRKFAARLRGSQKHVACADAQHAQLPHPLSCNLSTVAGYV